MIDLMSILNRNILICEMTKLPQQGSQRICYVPELAALQHALQQHSHKPFSSALKKQFDTIKIFSKQHGTGIFPYNVRKTKLFLEELYNHLLRANIALPPNLSEMDLQFIIKDYSKIKKNIFTHDVKIRIQHENLTFFAKYLPWIGTLVTFILTIGLTISTLISMLGWGWSIALLSVFGISKLLTSYADIAGGPERRMTLLGLWLDRLKSNDYRQFGKYSPAKIGLHCLVIAILACSSLLTWYGAWHLIRCMNGMSYFPDIVSTTLAGLFAWSSAGASFGRIYQDLYQLLFNYTSVYFDFDSFHDHEKLDIRKLEKRFHAPLKTVTPSKKRAVITPYQQHTKRQAHLLRENKHLQSDDSGMAVAKRPCFKV